MEKRSKNSQRLKIDRRRLAEVEQAEKEQLQAALFSACFFIFSSQLK
jgi:hypothetical protein